MAKLYHGSSKKIDGLLHPTLRQTSADYINNKAAVFATDRIDIASMFMFPEDHLASICFEQNIAFICIWGKPDDFPIQKGYLYIFNSDQFEKVGKDYEWQSFSAVRPTEAKEYASIIDGMIDNGVQVYFINNDPTFDLIVKNKDHRAPIVKNLISENQKRKINIKSFKL